MVKKVRPARQSGDLPARSRFGRLRAKAGFSGERECRERRWRLFSTFPYWLKPMGRK
jgi:hypothetical protein